MDSGLPPARKPPAKQNSMRERVYRYILSCGAAGATRPEIAMALGISENTVRPRVCELLWMRDEATGRARVRTDPSGAARGRCAVLLASPFLPDVPEPVVCYCAWAT